MGGLAHANLPHVVAKTIASRFRIFHAYVPTAVPMDYAEEAVDTAPLARYSQPQALDILDSEVEIEPQSSEQSNNGPTIIVSPSDDDTEVQSSTQSSEEGDQSIAGRTRLQLARQRPQPLHCLSNLHHRNSTHKRRLRTLT